MTEHSDQQDEVLAFNSVNVHETEIHHAMDALLWVDASSSENTAKKTRIEKIMHVQLDSQAKPMKKVNKAGAIVFWFNDAGAVEKGSTTDAQRIRPAAAPILLSGQIGDPSNHFQPRLFSLSVGSGEGHTIDLYPSPSYVRLNSAGGVIGNIAQTVDGNVKSVPWGIVELVVETAPAQFMTFTGQADSKGDFRIALTRLPPLPESVDFYEAELSVKADLNTSDNSPIDPDSLPAVNAGREDAAPFVSAIELNISPGEIRHIKSSGLSYLALQAT